MWVTHRLAQLLGLTDKEIAALETIMVYAPNNVSWQAYKVER